MEWYVIENRGGAWVVSGDRLAAILKDGLPANAELEVAEERAAKRTDHAAALKAHAECWMAARARDLARK